MKFEKLGNICDFQGGTQPPKEEWIDHPRQGYIRMLQIRDFTQKKEQHIEYVKQNPKLNTCNKEDILIGRYGASVGKILTGLEGAYNVAIIKTIPNETVLSRKYLYQVLISPSFQNFIQNIGGRAAQAGFNKEDISNYNLYLPPIADQHRIATILSKAEALIAQRKQSIALLDDYLKSTFLDMFGDPVRNEKGWEVKRLDKIAKLERGRFSPRPRNDPSYFDGNFPFIQTGDISKSGNRLNKYTQTLNEKGIKVSKKFNQGTIVIAIVGATIGATAILEIDVYATDSIIGITVKKEESNNYFLEFIMQFWKPILLKNAPEAARPNINLEILNRLGIIYPPLTLQNQFAAIVQKVEELKKQYQQSLGQLQQLFGSLSQRGFKGELNLKGNSDFKFNPALERDIDLPPRIKIVKKKANQPIVDILPIIGKSTNLSFNYNEGKAIVQKYFSKSVGFSFKEFNDTVIKLGFTATFIELKNFIFEALSEKIVMQVYASKEYMQSIPNMQYSSHGGADFVGDGSIWFLVPQNVAAK